MKSFSQYWITSVCAADRSMRRNSNTSRAVPYDGSAAFRVFSPVSSPSTAASVSDWDTPQPIANESPVTTIRGRSRASSRSRVPAEFTTISSSYSRLRKRQWPGFRR